MASSCPCGCGRKVAFSVKGSAIGARNMDVMLTEVEPFVEELLAAMELSGDQAGQLRNFLEKGQRIRGWFLDHVHKQARPGVTPDVLSLKRMMDEWGRYANSLASALTS